MWCKTWVVAETPFNFQTCCTSRIIWETMTIAETSLKAKDYPHQRTWETMIIVETSFKLKHVAHHENLETHDYSWDVLHVLTWFSSWIVWETMIIVETSFGFLPFHPCARSIQSSSNAPPYPCREVTKRKKFDLKEMIYRIHVKGKQ